MTGGNVCGADFVCILAQRSKFHLAVAYDTGIRRACGLIGVCKIALYFLFKLCFSMCGVERNTQGIGDTLRFGQTAQANVHIESMDIVALFAQQPCGYSRIDTARKS